MNGVRCEGGDQKRSERVMAREQGGSRLLREKRDKFGDEGLKRERSERGRIGGQKSRAIGLAFL